MSLPGAMRRQTGPVAGNFALLVPAHCPGMLLPSGQCVAPREPLPEPTVAEFGYTADRWASVGPVGFVLEYTWDPRIDVDGRVPDRIVLTSPDGSWWRPPQTSLTCRSTPGLRTKGGSSRKSVLTQDPSAAHVGCTSVRCVSSGTAPHRPPSAGLVLERIDHDDAIEFLAVLEVFGEQSVAAEVDGARHDQAVDGRRVGSPR